MSFGNTKTPLKPTGKAKYQLPMRATPESNGVKTYVLEGELKKKFIKLFPKNSNRRMMEWFGISFSTVQRFKNELGLKKDMKAIRRQLTMDVKKTCEENGWYDSLRGKPTSEACREGTRRLRASGFCPLKELKKKNPRRYKAYLSPSVRSSQGTLSEGTFARRIWLGAQDEVKHSAATNERRGCIVQEHDDASLQLLLCSRSPMVVSIR